MASGKGIEGPPSALISLDNPVDREHGRIQASVVQRLHGSRKRKRSEIAVGIDTSGIKIYDVQNPRLITSYPLSHETYFLSPPCSVYHKKTKDIPARRRTYAAIANAPPSMRRYEPPQIVCFSEEPQPDDVPRPEKYTFKFEESSPEVAAIDVLLHSGGDSLERVGYDVVVTLEDGQVVSFDEQLKDIRWRWRYPEGRDVETSKVLTRVVEHSVLVDMENARRGLLKGRRDVLAALGLDGDSTLPTTLSSKILFQVSRLEKGDQESSERCIDLFSLVQTSAAGLTSNVQPIRHLLSWTLSSPSPTMSTFGSSTAKHVLHATTGFLYVLVEGSVATYDLTGVVPELATFLRIDDNPFRSFLRISTNLLLTISPTSCGIYDVKFNATQDAQRFGLDSVASLSGKKRKRLGDSLRESFDYVSYFPDLDLAVGIFGNELVAQQITSSSRPTKRPRGDDNLLIDIIGRGTRTHQAAHTPPRSDHLPKFLKEDRSQELYSERWEQIRPGLDQSASREDVDEFERAFSNFIGIPRDDALNNREQPTSKINGLTNGTKVNGILHSEENSEEQQSSHAHGQEDVQSWVFLASEGIKAQQFRTQALYALSKIFSWVPTKEEAEPSPSLRIQFFPPNVFKWLLLANFVSVEMISQALCRSSPAPTPLRTIPSQELVLAVVQADASMRSLYDLLTLPTYLEIAACLQGIKVLIQTLDGNSGGEDIRTIMPAPASEVHGLTNGTRNQHDDNETIDSHLALATADLSYAESTLEHGIALRSTGLRYALMRLHSFPKQRVTKALREELSTREIVFLIHILRIELADGGWTSRYVDAGPAGLRREGSDFNGPTEEGTMPEFTPADGSVAIVAGLLGCAVDAVGVGGWLWAATHAPADRPAEEEDAGELLLTLRAEVSAALEGIHEVSFIREFLAEYLRYSEVLRQANATAPANEKRRNRKAKEKGELTRPITVKEEADLGIDGEVRMQLQAALPLGLKTRGGAELQTTKVGSGGATVTKSRRELGMEKSKRVGKYSFERIRV